MRMLAPPSPELVRAGRKHVDFYGWKGKTIARAWPRKAHNPRTAAQQLNRKTFGEISAAMRLVTGSERDALLELARDEQQTLRDVLMRASSGRLIIDGVGP
jgi:hypothetical protein